KILLQDEGNASGELAGLGEISDLVGVSKGGAFVSDQIEIMKSRRILRKVIQKHDLHIQYRNLGNIKNSEILEEQSPLKLMLLNSDAALLDSIEYAFTAVIQDEETVHIQDEKKQVDQNVGLGEKFDSPLGEILLMPQKNLKDYIDKPLEISYRPVEKMIASLGEAIEIQPGKDQQSYIVNLSLNSALPQKAVIILNTLVEEYNADISNDKKRILKATSDFINSRLNVVSKDMESADRDVAEFKGGNRVMDMSSEAQLYLNSASETETKLIEVQTQLQVAEMM